MKQLDSPAPDIDLFTIEGLEPPAGDLGIKPRVSACRAIWTTPLPEEEGAPAHRIIHARTLQLHAPATLHRLGVAAALGYHKCGSRMEFDWVTGFRVLAWDGLAWQVCLHKTMLPPPKKGERLWFELGDVRTSAAMVEIRSCGIDGWWPSWNLATGAFVLEGVAPLEKPPRGENVLTCENVSLDNLPMGVTAFHRNGEVRYRSRFLEVGFCLRRAGFSYLAIDDEGLGRTGKNLLWLTPGMSYQGVMLHPIGKGPTMAPSIRYAVEGRTTVHGTHVTYEMAAPGEGQKYSLEWDILEDRLRVKATRTGASEIRAWESSVWTTAFDARVSATSAGGRISREGETGVITPPLFVHAPGFGSFDIRTTAGAAVWRSDCFRPASLGIHQIKLGETAAGHGDHVLHAGIHRAEMEWTVRQFGVPLVPEAPIEIVRAVNRCSLTSMTYRADTGTLSNNGNSMHCALSMDCWSGLAVQIGEILPGVRATDLLRDSLERWLDGAPGYGSGGMFVDGDLHLAEDEYLMSGTAPLLAIGEFLDQDGSKEWLLHFGPQLARQIALVRGRDLDGDGLIESRYRLGNSGEYQWSTNFFDVISFGWKDAFSNALLYAALARLSVALSRWGRPAMAAGLDDWGERLRRNYVPTFLNESTGWLGGWRSKDGVLHDHAFLTVNGAAVACGLVDDDQARGIMRRLWAEAQRVGMPDPVLGIPTTLWPVPDEDLAEIMHGFPFGYYGNGGLSAAQSKHLVNALFKVGMAEEGEYVLRRLCASFADGLAFGGAKSGLDARTWDGWPCGYEGILTDQFGVLATAISRYRKK